MNDTTQSIEEQHSQGLTHQTNLNVVLVKTTHDQDSIDKVNAIQKLLLPKLPFGFRRDTVICLPPGPFCGTKLCRNRAK